MTSTWLSTLSHRCHARLDRKNLTVRQSRTVHAVDWVTGLGGIDWPVPACRIGTTGWELDAYVPTARDVTCLRCLRHITRDAPPPSPSAEVRYGQLALPIAA